MSIYLFFNYYYYFYYYSNEKPLDESERGE